MNSLDKTVRDFESPLALDGGKDGLLYYEKILDTFLSRHTLTSFVFEIGIDQSEGLSKLLGAHNIQDFTFFPDYQGILRILVVL